LKIHGEDELSVTKISETVSKHEDDIIEQAVPNLQAEVVVK
jgi:hypothetical protein